MPARPAVDLLPTDEDRALAATLTLAEAAAHRAAARAAYKASAGTGIDRHQLKVARAKAAVLFDLVNARFHPRLYDGTYDGHVLVDNRLEFRPDWPE